MPLAKSIQISWDQHLYTVTVTEVEQALATSTDVLRSNGRIELEYYLSNPTGCYVARECLLTLVFDLSGAYTIHLSDTAATVVTNTLPATFQASYQLQALE